jgi:uncharacterized protein (DUF1800 family)
MIRLAIPALLVVAAAPAAAAPVNVTAHEIAILNRVTWGMNASSAAGIARLGPDWFIEGQLHPSPKDALPAEAQGQIDAMSLSKTGIEQLAQEIDQQGKAANALTDPDQKKAAQQAYQEAMNRLGREAATRSLLRDLYSPDQLQAQMTWFWLNHFNVHLSKANIRVLIGDYEEGAIRPRALGRFRDLLGATVRHPAMLRYLDNDQNAVGHINENYARELMELHTLGVNGGYTQDDVTSLARIITGWTYAGRLGQLGQPGTFVFNNNAHEPGAQRVLGKVYEAGGLAQGEAVLSDIARHPSTAKFIATKFARHFVADDPSPALVARLQDVFIKTDGDLRLLANALVDSDEAWTAPLSKMRSPYEYMIATRRILSRVPEEPGGVLGGLNLLGQPLWSPAGPNGFPDTNAAWAAPEGMKLRLDIAAQTSARLPDAVDPRELLELAAADATSDETRRTIERAESRQQAMALLLMSPEFQRR